MTYLVMEVHASYAVVIDEQGRFFKVANMGYQVGERLDEVFAMQIKAPQPRKKIIIIIAAIVLCLAAAITLVLVNLDNAPTIPPDNPGNSAEMLSSSDALAIALSHAGLTEDQLLSKEIDYEDDDNRFIYEISFEISGLEYQYEVDAISGEVISFQQEAAENGMHHNRGHDD